MFWKKKKLPFAVQRYHYPIEVVEAALSDIAMVETMLNQLRELAPHYVSWNEIDRHPTYLDIEGRYTGYGFDSVESAINIVIRRIAGLRLAVTSDFSSLMSVEDAREWDRAVRNFLEKVKAKYCSDERKD
jgi:hypothetical protein